jgi:hypothetical protein
MARRILIFIYTIFFCIAAAYAQGGTTGPLTWKISKDTLTISGNGSMPNYDHPVSPPWYPHYGKFNTVIIG